MRCLSYNIIFWPQDNGSIVLYTWDVNENSTQLQKLLNIFFKPCGHTTYIFHLGLWLHFTLWRNQIWLWIQVSECIVFDNEDAKYGNIMTFINFNFGTKIIYLETLILISLTLIHWCVKESLILVKIINMIICHVPHDFF